MSLNDGAITFTPVSGFVGEATIEYTVSDGFSNGSTVGTITFHMMNLPPTAGNYEFIARPGNTVLVSLDLFTDPDDDDVTVAALGVPSQGSATVDAWGVVTYTPFGQFTGTESFSYTLTDGFWNGSAVGNILIHFVNAAPVANDLSFTVGHGTVVAGNVLSAATDGNDDVLTAVQQSGVPTAQGGFVTVAADGGFTYTPEAGYVGPDAFTFSIADGYGGVTTGVVSIDLTNAAPTVGNLSFTTNRATPVTANLLAGAADADGDPLTVSIAPSTYHGSIALDATTGAFTYTPATDWVGVETIPFTVSDGFGGGSSRKPYKSRPKL